jgi:hypothetical protein
LNGNINVARVLLERDASMENIGPDGKNAMDHAVARENKEMIRLLEETVEVHAAEKAEKQARHRRQLQARAQQRKIRIGE